MGLIKVFFYPKGLLFYMSLKLNIESPRCHLRIFNIDHLINAIILFLTIISHQKNSEYQIHDPYSNIGNTLLNI